MKLIGVPENVAWNERTTKGIDGVLNLKPKDYPTVIMLFFEANAKDSWRYGSFKSKKPVYMPNKVLDAAWRNRDCSKRGGCGAVPRSPVAELCGACRVAQLPLPYGVLVAVWVPHLE